VGNPTSDEVFAATDAIRADASVWSQMAEQLDDAAQVAASLSLTAFHFSFVGHLVGMDDMYADLQQRVASLLTQGATTFDEIATALCGSLPTITTATSGTPSID
jgi:predicted DNA repair protein MutK